MKLGSLYNSGEEGGDRMKRWKPLLVMPLLLMAACLLIGGAHRLIAFPEQENAGMPVYAREVYLCSAPSQINEWSGCADRQEHPLLRAMADALPAPRVPSGLIALGADANGNVLGKESYVRSVYHAFALGDGFV